MTQAGWKTLKLSDVSRDISYGFTARASATADGPRMLRITDIQDNRVDWSSVPRCECEEPSKYLLRSGDIVVARTGATTGKSFLLREVPEPAVFASYLIRIQPTADVDPAFLANFMRSPRYWDQITRVSKGTAQPGANATILGQLDVPVPPVDEQRRIVAKLEGLQTRSRRARETLDAVPPLLEKLRQSILAAALRGDLTKAWRAKNPDVEPASKLLERIRAERRRKWEEAELARMIAKGNAPRDDRWRTKYKPPQAAAVQDLPSLPLGWCWATVEEISERITDGTHQTPTFTTAGVPFIVIANVIDGEIQWDAVRKWVSPETYRLHTAGFAARRGDVLYTAVGSYGVATVVDTDEPFMFQRHIAVIRPISAVIDSRLLTSILNSPQSKARADAVARGVAQKTVTLGDLSKFPIPVAPYDEQVGISESLQALLQRLAVLKSSARLVQTMLTDSERATLGKAFAGRL